ncbi:ACT domain-containing protein [soil metagenome]
MSTSSYSDIALRLSVLEDRFAVCRLEPDSEVPSWAAEAEFFSVTYTPSELSIVCTEQNVPEEVRREDGWRALGIEGPLDFSLIGILASIVTPLAEASVSIFATSTYNTDYVLVREDQLDLALAALRDHGHEIIKT